MRSISGAIRRSPHLKLKRVSSFPMLKSVNFVPSLNGELTVPGDKSVTHRALLLNAIGRGTAKVTNASWGEDIAATLDCLKLLGVTIVQKPDEFLITGAGLHGLKEPSAILSADQSGTTMRLMSGLLAGQDFLTVLTGDRGLLNRPMDRVIEPLRQMGATVLGRKNDMYAPLAIRGGHLHGMDYKTKVASAQVKSCILLAGLYASSETTVDEPAYSRDHTELMMAAMGVKVTVKGHVISIAPPKELTCVDINVPGDFSSAAFWMAAAVIHPNAKITLRNVGVNPTRTGLFDVLEMMGAKVRMENKRMAGAEPVADIVAESSRLKGVEIGADIIPRLIDEAPSLALVAAFANGRTVIRDAGELRLKESDRISTTVEELSKLGAMVSEEGTSTIIIEGGARLHGGEVTSHGDHRLAMTLAAAGVALNGPVKINGAESVDKSYPTFWEDLDKLSATSRV